ncbi:MAG: GNAT family protein [Cyanobacteria bacterium J06626_18]
MRTWLQETAWTLKIETKRLMLRPQAPGDYEAWYAALAHRLPQQHQYDEGLINLEGCDAAWFKGICQHHQDQALADYAYIWAVFSKQTEQHLGYVDLLTIQREEKQWANLGYGIHNQYWRQGLGKEAVRAALIAGFEQLGYHRIEAAINLDNAASIALAESVGLQKECIRRGFYYEKGQWVDHIIYVGLPADFGLVEGPPAIAPHAT